MVKMITLFIVTLNIFCVATESVSISIHRGDNIIEVNNNEKVEAFLDDKLKISCSDNLLTFCKKSNQQPIKIQTINKILTNIPLNHIKKSQLWFGVLSRHEIFGRKLNLVKQTCRSEFVKFSNKCTHNPYESAQKKLVRVVIVKRVKGAFEKVFQVDLHVHISKLYAVLDQAKDSLSVQIVNYQKDSFAYVYCVRNNKIEILFPKDDSQDSTPYKEQLFVADIEIDKDVCYLLFFHEEQHRSKNIRRKYLQELNEEDFEGLFSEGEFISQRTGAEIMAIKDKKQILSELENLVAFKIKKHKLAGR
ncbi:hypothetical protein [Candidatus Uabimicrobium amorphum]|uniref:Uncharacterized protein n=1 Tax=Uabimicrobium amorphum TaxID=2596890 RepID=A0A5S9ISW5_UABAM|nr:hypothetical protein [Candidatus Uabimicrobium amorphum]BBM87137.1 hypothetical protein UABAM_05540 [Candidatus Uabimicrobium amorphum]